MSGATWVGQTPTAFGRKLVEIGKRAQNIRPVADAWGRRITVQSIPEAVLAGGRPKPFKPVLRFGVWAPTPLWNIGKMVNAIYYEPRRDGCTVFSGRNTPQARILHYGGVIRGNPFLVIPAVIEAAKKTYRDFPEGFWIVPGRKRRSTSKRHAQRTLSFGGLGSSEDSGYRGPGYYRRTNGRLEKLFYLARKVEIPKREWFQSQESDRAWLLEMTGGYIVRGER